jgi:hypothetical protein
LINVLCNSFSITERTDNTGRLTEAKLCEIVGVSQQYRQSLVRRQLLREPDQAGCGRADAIELGAIERLAHHLTPNEVAVAWSQLREAFRGRLPGRQLDVVFDRELGTATVVRSDQDLRAAVIGGHAVVVVELGSRLQEIVDAFNRWSAVAAPARARGARRNRATGSA